LHIVIAGEKHKNCSETNANQLKIEGQAPSVWQAIATTPSVEKLSKIKTHTGRL